MELPFLKNKNKNTGAIVEQAVTNEDSNNLLEAAAKELMEAIHKKDIGGMRSALKACYQAIRSE